MTGTTWIDEAGSFNLPIVLSNTHAVGACHTGVITWVNRIDPSLAHGFVAIFLGGAATATLAMVLIALTRPRARRIESVEARYEFRAMNHEWG